MRYSFLLFIFTVIQNTSVSAIGVIPPDTLCNDFFVLANGDTMNVKILKIKNYTVSYRRCDINSRLKRSKDKKEIEKIIYADGTERTVEYVEKEKKTGLKVALILGGVILVYLAILPFIIPM